MIAEREITSLEGVWKFVFKKLFSAALPPAQCGEACLTVRDSKISEAAPRHAAEPRIEEDRRTEKRSFSALRRRQSRKTEFPTTLLDASREEVKEPVLLVGNFLSASMNVRFVCEDLAEQLEAAGQRVLITSGRRNRAARLLDMLMTAWQKRDEYAVAQVDVYSGAAFVWAEAVCWVLRRAGKPYVLTLHGGNLPVFARRHGGRVRRLLRSAAAVTTPSAYLQQRMTQFRHDLSVVPNPVALDRYEFRQRTQPSCNLMWLRAFHAQYNPTLAARVMALLVNEFADVHLTMVGADKGDGSLSAVRRVAAELQVTSRITMVGGVPKSAVAEWMQRGDIFLNTTNADNMPVSVIEAMACGLCVVSTNVGGLPYLLEDGEDALLVAPDDAEAMAEAIRRVLREDGLAARLSANGRRKVEGFDWARVLPQWQSLLASVAGKHER